MGYVYFLHNWSDGADLYKIGISKHEDITKRIKQLSTGNPYENTAGTVPVPFYYTWAYSTGEVVSIFWVFHILRSLK